MTVKVRPQFNQNCKNKKSLGGLLVALMFVALAVWNVPSVMAEDETAVADEVTEAVADEDAAPATSEAEESDSSTEEPATEDPPVEDQDESTEVKEEADEEAKEETKEETKEEPKEEEPKEEEAKEEEAPAVSKAGPAAKAFDETFTRWKELLKTLRDLKAEYSIAAKPDLPALREQWKQRIADGETLQIELNAAALAAYDEAPNEDRELVRYLITVASEQIRNDEYGSAKELLDKMMAGGCDEKVVPDLAGIASFCTNDFDSAKEHFAKAAENNALSREGTRYKGDVENCQKNWVEEAKLREAEAEADDLPRVKLETSSGDIVIELFENEAPETVGNFISLIEKGYYDGLAFHRVLDAFMAQGGCPKGDGSGGPGSNIYCECVNDNHRKHFSGSLSMAKQAAVNTGGSQFFITFVPTTSLDGLHTVFGRVIEGMDNAIHITRIDPGNPENAAKPTTIEKATVIRKRDHEYRPNKVKS